MSGNQTEKGPNLHDFLTSGRAKEHLNFKKRTTCAEKNILFYSILFRLSITKLHHYGVKTSYSLMMIITITGYLRMINAPNQNNRPLELTARFDCTVICPSHRDGLVNWRCCSFLLQSVNKRRKISFWGF